MYNVPRFESVPGKDDSCSLLKSEYPALGDPDGDIDDDIDLLGLIELDELTEALGLTDALTELDGLTDLDGLVEADGLLDADGDIDGLTELDGLTDALGDVADGAIDTWIMHASCDVHVHTIEYAPAGVNAALLSPVYKYGARELSRTALTPVDAVNAFPVEDEIAHKFQQFSTTVFKLVECEADVLPSVAVLSGCPVAFAPV